MIGDTEEGTQVVRTQPPPDGGEGVRAIMERLKASSGPSLLPNPWREAYYRDVAWLLERLPKEALDA